MKLFYVTFEINCLVDIEAVSTIRLTDSERTLEASKYASFSFRGAFSLYVDSKGIRLTCRLEHFPTVEYTGSRSRWPPSKNMRRHGCSRAKRSRGAAERGNAQGGKRRGKAFFHMLIHQAGCAHEYLWSKRAFLSFPSLPLPLSAAIFPRSLALSLYTRCLKTFALSPDRRW